MPLQYVVTNLTTSLAAATGKVIVELPTGSTAGLTVIGLEVYLDAAAPGSCVVEWCTYATTGTGTTVTATKWGSAQSPAAILGTVKINDSVLPGTIASAGLPSWILPLPGSYSLLQPLYREMWQPESTLRCIRVTSTLASNIRCNVIFEQ